VLDGALDHLRLRFEETAQVHRLRHQVLMVHRVTLVGLHDLHDVALNDHVALLFDSRVCTTLLTSTSGLLCDGNLGDEHDLDCRRCVFEIQIECLGVVVPLQIWLLLGDDCALSEDERLQMTLENTLVDVELLL